MLLYWSCCFPLKFQQPWEYFFPSSALCPSTDLRDDLLWVDDFQKEGEELPSFLKLLFFGTNGLFYRLGRSFFLGKVRWSDAPSTWRLFSNFDTAVALLSVLMCLFYRKSSFFH